HRTFGFWVDGRLRAAPLRRRTGKRETCGGGAARGVEHDHGRRRFRGIPIGAFPSCCVGPGGPAHCHLKPFVLRQGTLLERPSTNVANSIGKTGRPTAAQQVRQLRPERTAWLTSASVRHWSS